MFFYSYFSIKVCEMMFSLASKLASAKTSGNALQFYFIYMYIHVRLTIF